MAVPSNRDYWNHNTAYHPWLLSIAAEHRGDVLDIGCGDGLLAQRLARVSRSVTGIDPDPAAIGRATDRLASHPLVGPFGYLVGPGLLVPLVDRFAPRYVLPTQFGALAIALAVNDVVGTPWLLGLVV